MLGILLQGFLLMAQTSPGTSDDFEGYKSSVWPQGATRGPWVHEYHGYGSVGVHKELNGSKVLYQKPKASLSLDETHASLVLSQKVFNEPTIAYRSKVVQQLRKPTANSWETAWVVWNYTNDHRFYYFAFKTNGWELGKVDNTKLNPNGPECLWPQYLNCKYNGAQRFLRTGESPRVKIGQWDSLQVQQVGNTFSVKVGDQLVVKYTDTQTPYKSGHVGFYNEDAYVRFDNIKIKSNTVP